MLSFNKEYCNLENNIFVDRTARTHNKKIKRNFKKKGSIG